MMVAEAVQIFLDMDAVAAVGLIVLMNAAWWAVKGIAREGLAEWIERRRKDDSG